MLPLIGEKTKEIGHICESCRVQKLEAFGSAVRGDQRVGESDLDFLVEFQQLAPKDHADAYFRLLGELENLFRCPIDLIEKESVRNLFLMAALEEERDTLYAA